MKQTALTPWTHDDSAELYGIRNWGSGYFDVSAGGSVVVRPGGAGEQSAELLSIILDLQRRGLSMPVLLRFSGIIASQVGLIQESFGKAIREAGYKGTYRGVYPIKVNQKQQVICDILDSGRDFHHGLEAGSKAELIAAVASLRDPEAFLVCNGYKDSEFVDLALLALKAGLSVVVVIEMPAEALLVIERAAALGVRPLLGVRAKLSSRAGGHWEGSGGDRSKFGLDASQVIGVVETLREAGMLDCLQMLHYHLGSQVPDIRKVRTALKEACRFYADLVHEGAPMGAINVGGGLAVDYDGSQTNFASSRNYSVLEYAADVVEVIMDTLDAAGIAHPTIVSESGRASVAHHSVLVFDVLHARRFDPPVLPEELPEDSSEMLRNLMYVRNTLTPRNVQESFHDAVYYRENVRAMFMQGDVPLRERALAEDIFWHIIRRIADTMRDRRYIPDEMAGLEHEIADVYYGNFSLFQSLPDSWAIDQLFPVMPIHRLDERPSRQAVLADISCDSDGKIDTFIDLRDVKKSLPLHELNEHEYYLGAFLVGAYQEALGDMHNLLGDVNIVHVKMDGEDVDYVREMAGDTVEEVLSSVEYDSSELLGGIMEMADQAVRDEKITRDEGDSIVAAFTDGMKGYTYFER